MVPVTPGGVLDRFDAAAWAAAADNSPRGRWVRQARPNQMPPSGDWAVWLILAGRGWGKTRSGAECVAELARRFPGCRIALVAPTFADARDVMVEGVSGLLYVFDQAELRGGTVDSAWNRSLGELWLANESRFKIYSSERPSALRGPGNHFAWGDEAAHWLDAHKGTARDTTWSNLRINVREKAQPGWPAYRTRIVITTTPKPVALLKVPDNVARVDTAKAGLMQMPGTVLTHGKTNENLDNLSDDVRDLLEQYAGTTTARQEFDAELLEDNDDAYLPRSLVERCRISPGEVFSHVLSGTRVVAVDPAVTENDDSDLTGISVVGRGADGVVYVLGDYALKASPERWAMTVWHAVYTYNAAAVIVEDNQGGDMVEHTLRTAWDRFVRAWRVDPNHRRVHMTAPGSGEDAYDVGRLLGMQGSVTMPVSAMGLRPVPIKRVHPSGAGSGKWLRAQPLRLLYEQGKVRHVMHPAEPGHWFALEDQLTTWTGSKGEKSPDRIDALVHGVDFLLLPGERAKDRLMQPGRVRARAATISR